MSTPTETKQPREPNTDEVDNHNDKPSSTKHQKNNNTSVSATSLNFDADPTFEDGMMLVITTPEMWEALAYEVPVRFFNRRIRPLIAKCQ